jgi:transposase InsO family protein
LSPEAKQCALQALHAKSYLGPERLAWDLRNQEGIRISPSTIKRLKRTLYEQEHPPATPVAWRFYERHHPHSLWHGDFMEKVTLADSGRRVYQLTLLDDYSRGYVFCDLVLDKDLHTTITALITAMRQWRIIPTAVLFDNGSPFQSALLAAFCTNLGVRLIHAAVRHPQTNGKLERAFRDDMREFYQHATPWQIESLRRDLPAYVHYRNYIRGHHALHGQPSITRLREQNRMALPWVLEQLERYAQYEMARKVVSPRGCIRLLGRAAFIDTALAGVEVTLHETLEGVEVRMDGHCGYILRDYAALRQLHGSYLRRQLPTTLTFEPYAGGNCPRNAVAYRQ